MKKKINIAVTVLFFAILLSGLAGVFFGRGQDRIRAERRRAAAFPAVSLSGILEREVMDGIEDYMRDHTVFRQEMRRWKADTLKNVLAMKENNGLYQVQDGIYSLEYPLNEDKVVRAAEKFSGIVRDYFPAADVYYAVIPDKNYFTARKNGYPAMDYERLFSLMHENMTEASYIEIEKLLSAGDYYRTDLHWKQEEITDVADLLLASMTGSVDAQGYDVCAEYSVYYGSYAAQSGWKVEPDTIVCLTSPVIEGASVTDYEKNVQIPVYAVEFLSEETQSMDAYDVYLSGAKALLQLENTKNADGGELVLFRDSFGSSIAPLLLRGYSKITMIDLRYVTMEYASRILKLPQQCDVLFLYNTQLLNHSDSMR